MPDGGAAERIVYRSGKAVDAAVADNAFTFMPPQRSIRKRAAAIARIERLLSREHLGMRERAFLDHRASLLWRSYARKLTPRQVQWLDSSGQVIGEFHPASERA